MIQFDWTVTLGTVLATAGIVAGTWAAVGRLYNLLDKRIAIFEVILQHHGRMEKYEEVIALLVGQMQLTVGRVEELMRPKQGEQP